MIRAAQHPLWGTTIRRSRPSPKFVTEEGFVIRSPSCFGCPSLGLRYGNIPELLQLFRRRVKPAMAMNAGMHCSNSSFDFGNSSWRVRLVYGRESEPRAPNPGRLTSLCSLLFCSFSVVDQSSCQLAMSVYRRKG